MKHLTLSSTENLINGKEAAEYFGVPPHSLYAKLSTNKAKVKPGVFNEFHKGESFPRKNQNNFFKKNEP